MTIDRCDPRDQYPFYKERRPVKIYSLRDKKLGEFGQLVCMPTDEAVIRALKDSLGSGQAGTMNKYPEDFELYELGDMDVEEGRIVVTRLPRLVVNVGVLAQPEETAA